MKKIVGIVFLLFSITALAQDWEATYAEALVASKNGDKPIVLVFAGSDWCAPCIKLERSIWQSDEFVAFSKANYILYKADFPRKKNNQLPGNIANQNKLLADKFNPKGHFPLVLVLDSKENVLGTTGYERLHPKAYISRLNSFIK